MDLTKLVSEEVLEEEKKRYDRLNFHSEPHNEGVPFASVMDALKDLSENYTPLTEDPDSNAA